MKQLNVYKYKSSGLSYKLVFLDSRGFQYRRNYCAIKLQIHRNYLGFTEYDQNDEMFKFVEMLEFKTWKELQAYIIYKIVNFDGIRSRYIVGDRYEKACKVLRKNYPELVI